MYKSLFMQQYLTIIFCVFRSKNAIRAKKNDPEDIFGVAMLNN